MTKEGVNKHSAVARLTCVFNIRNIESRLPDAPSKIAKAISVFCLFAERRVTIIPIQDSTDRIIKITPSAKGMSRYVKKAKSDMKTEEAIAATSCLVRLSLRSIPTERQTNRGTQTIHSAQMDSGIQTLGKMRQKGKTMYMKILPKYIPTCVTFSES